MTKAELRGYSTVFSAVLISFIISLIFNSSIHKASLPIMADESKIAIVLDAGHGGEDCGAIGVNGVYEKDLNLAIAIKLGDYLKTAGFKVIYTRTEDKLLYTEDENIKGFRKIHDLKNRVNIANRYENALFVSIHMNSYGSP